MSRNYLLDYTAHWGGSEHVVDGKLEMFHYHIQYKGWAEAVMHECWGGAAAQSGEDALPGHVVGGGCLALLKDYLELLLVLVLVCISIQTSR